MCSVVVVEKEEEDLRMNRITSKNFKLSEQIYFTRRRLKYSRNSKRKEGGRVGRGQIHTGGAIDLKIDPDYR
jgi:hypothetical protein